MDAPLKGYLEFMSVMEDGSYNFDPAQLIQAARESEIRTFGWPIGLVMTVDEYAPKPYVVNGVVAGVVAEIKADNSYDYWTLKKNGQYYIFKSLFEDNTKYRKDGPGTKLFFDTRTIRTTELLARTAGLYKALDVKEDERIKFKIKYGGLKDRTLASANPAKVFIYEAFKCSAEYISKEYSTNLKEFLSHEYIKDVVFDYIYELCQACNMFRPQKEHVNLLANEYLNGRVY